MPQLKAALRFGADAVYGALKNYGLRASAGNFSWEELQEALCRDDLSPDMRKKLSALEKSIDADRDNNYLMLGKLKQQ